MFEHSYHFILTLSRNMAEDFTRAPFVAGRTNPPANFSTQAATAAASLSPWGHEEAAFAERVLRGIANGDYNEAHYRSCLMLLLSPLAMQVSAFELIGEHDIRVVNTKGSTPVHKTAMFRTLQSVLGRLNANGQADEARVGFLYPDLVLLLHCRCPTEGCSAKDCIWTMEVKAYRERASMEAVVKRAVLTHAMRMAWMQLEMKLGAVPWSHEGAMKVRVVCPN